MDVKPGVDGENSNRVWDVAMKQRSLVLERELFGKCWPRLVKIKKNETRLRKLLLRL